MAQENYVIEMRNITKQFGTFKANDNINLTVRPGEIHALLGENGAGKSTLMNILSGLLEPTSGEIFMNGSKVSINGPTTANHLGIGMVHQHFMLVDAFTVTENIVLGSEPTKVGILDRKKATAEIKRVSEQYGLSVDPGAYIRDISVGAQQRVEILKTLYRGADVLIFDEPTAVLTPQEIDELIDIMRGLVQEGKSIILITHKLDEIKKVADRCTVIRRGQSIDTVNVRDVSSQQLADMMVGRSVSFKTEKKIAEPKEVVLSIKDLVVKESRGLEAVKGLSLDVRAGEVVGIAGIDGNGQTELIQALTGLRKADSGSVELRGEVITNKHPRAITEAGVGHVPEDRHKYGLILDMSLAENIALQTYYKKPLSNTGVLNYKQINSYARRLIEEYDVRTVNELVPAKALSGGNQQKAIIAREIDRDPDLLIVSQPTRGLDVGAIEYIHKRLIEQRDKEKAVLVVSFELDEILNVSDRIAVIHAGKIVGIVDPKETTENELGLLMAGYSLEEARAELRQEAGEAVE
ncbi:heme ABC transporter ATP-binding protein [Enterococcus ureilyticus]|uniref:Heme ABC transporter ATP-binding protein n=1 Tax=Enterococcus ureilyticus TaxID=1131292 RepID=A0A1E5H963_9ENTE|nr:ABC transporter ATP-binding protein [Enterococcus ureilyticus]MBM7687544.1 simple sugar transport system ATP-binding protein [Enterococcus ureilyticus]OEG21376.1 heme ABC transporter ATP-binding protein [Enterococcus ureilyticus]